MKVPPPHKARKPDPESSTSGKQKCAEASDGVPSAHCELKLHTPCRQHGRSECSYFPHAPLPLPFAGLESDAGRSTRLRWEGVTHDLDMDKRAYIYSRTPGSVS